MKIKALKKALSLLLTVVIVFTMIPAPSFATENGSVVPVSADEVDIVELLARIGVSLAEKDNTEQSDDLYIIGENRYKVIYNDYIACYVDAKSGGYIVLPASVPLDTDASQSAAVFTIDGEQYVFGGDYPEMNTMLFRPEVREDMIVTNWCIGDYVISQYHAITQDLNHENSYAVKIAYTAEYFGAADRQSVVSARIIVPVMLGSDGAAPLFTGQGGMLLGGTVLAPVPDEMWMESGNGPQAFFVTNEQNADIPAPDRMALGNRDELLAGIEPQQFTELTDPAAAFTFGARTLFIPDMTSDDLNTNVCAFLVNYGYYDLTAAQLDLTVDESAEASQLILTSELPADMYTLEFNVLPWRQNWEQGRQEEHYNMDTGGLFTIASMTWQLGDDMPVRVPVSGQPLYSNNDKFLNLFDVPLGATVYFSLEYANEAEEERVGFDVVSYLPPPDDEFGNNRERLSPDGDGMYTFTVTEYSFIEIFAFPKPGYVPLDWDIADYYIYPDSQGLPSVVVSNWSPSRYAVKPGETVSMTLTGNKPFYLPGRDVHEYVKPGLYYQTTSGAVNGRYEIIGADEARYPDQSGIMNLSFTVPEIADITEVGINWVELNTSAWGNVAVNIFPRDAIADGGTLDINTVGGSWVSGIYRVPSGATVTVTLPELDDAYNRNNSYLSAVDLNTGSYLAVNIGETLTGGVNFPLDSLGSAGDTISFTVPNDYNYPEANVEVRLTAGNYPKITTSVEYFDDTDASLSDVSDFPAVPVTVLPEMAEHGDSVTVIVEKLLDGDGKTPFDWDRTTVMFTGVDATGTLIGQSAFADMVVSGREFEFVIPGGVEGVRVTVQMYTNAPLLPSDPPERVPVYTLKTQPLVEAGTIRVGVQAWQRNVDGSGIKAFAQDGTTIQLEAGANVYFNVYPVDGLGSWQIDKVYLAQADDPFLTPIDGYENLGNGYDDTTGTYVGFEMPNCDAVLVVQGGIYEQPIKHEAVFVVGSQVQNGDYLNAPSTPMTGTHSLAYAVEPDSNNRETAVPVDSAMPGDVMYVHTGSKPFGYNLVALYLIRDGYPTINLMDNPAFEKSVSNWGRYYMFQMVGRGATLREVYELNDPILVTYDLPEDTTGLRMSVPEKHYLYTNEYEIGGEYWAEDILYLYNDSPETRAYWIDPGTTTKDGVTVSITLGGGTANSNYYRIRISWPLDGTVAKPSEIVIPIQSQSVDYATARFDGAVPNHTNPEEFKSVTVFGQFSTDTLKTEEIFLVVYEPNLAYGVPPVEHKYKIDYAAADGAITQGTDSEPDKLTLDLSQPGAIDTQCVICNNTESSPDWSEMGETPVVDGDPHPNDMRPWGIEVGTTMLFMTGSGTSQTADGGSCTAIFYLHDATVNFANQFNFLSIIVTSSPGNINVYSLKVGHTEAEVQATGGAKTVLTFFNEKGFFPNDSENPTVVAINEKAGSQTIGFDAGMSLYTPFASGTLVFEADSTGVHMRADHMHMNALNLPIFTPSYLFDTSSVLLMDMMNGQTYSMSGEYNPIVFEPLGNISMNIGGWEGFSVGIDKINLTSSTITISGGLYMTWPFVDEPFGNITIDKLELGIGNGEELIPSFSGIIAEGGFELPNLYVIGGNAYARINTFINDYYIEAAAEVGPVSLGGFLELKESERLGIWLPNSFMFDVNAGEVGVPLVPPVVVGWITGITGGVNNLVDTIDYDWNTTMFPEISLTTGAHFKLVQLFSFDVVMTTGFFKMSATISGSVEIADVGVDFLDHLSYTFGVFNESARFGSSKTRAYAKFAVDLGLRLSNSIIGDFIVGTIGGEFGVKFDNPFEAGKSLVFKYLEEKRTSLDGKDLLDFVNDLALECVTKAQGSVTMNFPQVLAWGPFRIAGAYVYAYFSALFDMNTIKDGIVGGGGWFAARACLLEDLRGWIVYNVITEAFSYGLGDLPDFYLDLMGIQPLSLSLPGGSQEIGNGLRVIADSQHSPVAGGQMSVMAFGQTDEIQIYSGMQGGMYTRSFKLPVPATGSYFLAIRQIEGTDLSDLRLYAPDGSEYTLSMHDGSEEAAQEDAQFQYNTVTGTDEYGQPTWLIALPEDDTLNAQGEWMLKSTNDMFVQIWQQDPLENIGEISLGGTGIATGSVSIDKNEITIPLVNLKPQGGMTGQANYQFSLDLVRRNSPDGTALDTISIPLGTVLAGKDQDDKDIEFYTYFGDVAQGSSPANPFDLTVELDADKLPSDVTPGLYYPEVVLHRYYGKDTSDSDMRLPINRAVCYEPITIGNDLFDGVTARNQTASAGQNQSILVEFDGASGTLGYAALKAAGYLLKGYEITAYGEDGLPAVAKPAAVTTLDNAALNPAPANITASRMLTYDDAGNLVDMSEDLSHAVSLTGLVPGTYTVGVTPVFMSVDNTLAESRGVSVVTNAVTIVEAVPPELTVNLSGGTITKNDRGGTVYCVSPNFELDVATNVSADIQIIRYRDKAVLKSGTGTQSVALGADEYFAAHTELADPGDPDSDKIVGGYETLVIYAEDPTTKGSTTMLVTVIPELAPPTLVLDGLVGGKGIITTSAEDGTFVVNGRTRPGLTVRLLNAAAPAAETADGEGRFSLSGALPQGKDTETIGVQVTSTSGLVSSQTITIKKLTSDNITALKLSPAGPLSVAPGDTIALVVTGLLDDGTEASLTPGGLTFTTTGCASVDANGILSITGYGSGTVVAKLGSVESNTLKVDAQAPVTPSDPPPAAAAPVETQTYTVRFDSNGGSAVAEQSVKGGAKAQKPADPAKEGYEFAGWYSDSGLTQPFDFTAAVTADITLFAKWDEAAEPDDVTQTNPFDDVSESDWFYDDVMYAYFEGLMLGTQTNMFSPDTSLTRGMVVTILYRYAGSPDMSGIANTFTDVGDDEWYNDAVKWAVKNAIVNGYGDNLFGPADDITRQDLAVILWRFAKYLGIDVTTGAMDNLQAFNDAGAVSDYAYDAMRWTCGMGIIGGKPDAMLDPLGNATRAETAAMIHRFLETLIATE